MKKFVALLLALLLFCTFALAENGSDEETDFFWSMQDGMLAVYVRTHTADVLSWSASVTEEGMLELQAEQYVADETTLDGADARGSWVTSWLPLPDAAGIVEIILFHSTMGNESPEESWRMELYLDGAGHITVLSLNGEEVEPLPVD